MKKTGKDTLSHREEKILNEFISSLLVQKRITKEPIVIAMIGLVGSGKGTVAHELARYMPFTIITNDNIRIRLRDVGIGYDHVRVMAEHAAEHVLKNGGNVIMDSDYVDAEKRSTLLAIAARQDASVYFIRVYANRDVVLKRLLSKEYTDESFFGGSKTDTGAYDGMVVALRELWRRTPEAL